MGACFCVLALLPNGNSHSSNMLKNDVTSSSCWFFSRAALSFVSNCFNSNNQLDHSTKKARLGNTKRATKRDCLFSLPRQIFICHHDKKSGVTCWFFARASISLVSTCFNSKNWMAACSFFLKIRLDHTKSYKKELLLLFWLTSAREAGFSSGGKVGIVMSDLWRSTLLFRQNY